VTDVQPHSEEIQRIREEYARRDQEIPEDFYSLEHAGNLFIYMQRMRAVIEALKREKFFPLKRKEILEVGFGKGDWLVDFERWGAEPERLHGIELDKGRVRKVRNRLSCADLQTGDASTLSWNDSVFDLVLQSTVFTSILDSSLKSLMAREMIRVLKPGGFILWYDFCFNNPKNPNVRGIRGSELRQLFSGCTVKLKRITLAPPITRWLAQRSWLACTLLEQMYFLNTHYLAIIRKGPSDTINRSVERQHYPVSNEFLFDV